MTNTWTSQMCKNPIFQHRIDDYILDEQKKLNINSYVNRFANKYENQGETFRFATFNEDLFPTHINDQIKALIQDVKDWSVLINHRRDVYRMRVQFYTNNISISKSFNLSKNDYVYILTKLIYYHPDYYNDYV